MSSVLREQLYGGNSVLGEMTYAAPSPPIPPRPGGGTIRSATQATNAELRIDLDYVLDIIEAIVSIYGPYPAYPYRLHLIRSQTRATNIELKDDADYARFIIDWIKTENAITVSRNRPRILRTTTQATNGELRIDITELMYEAEYIAAL